MERVPNPLIHHEQEQPVSSIRRGIFAIGLRRFLDWMDWMLPQAWDSWPYYVKTRTKPITINSRHQIEYNSPFLGGLILSDLANNLFFHVM